MTADPEVREPCLSPEPPRMRMTTRAGEYWGNNGSFCAFRGSCGLCADRAYLVSEYIVVHPDDTVTISMPEGTLMGGGSLCSPACPPTLRFGAVDSCSGQPQRWTTQALDEDQPWRVSQAPGVYQLVVDTHFTGDNGASGSTSAVFGLIVDSACERGPGDAPAPSGDCLPDPAAMEGDAGL